MTKFEVGDRVEYTRDSGWAKGWTGVVIPSDYDPTVQVRVRWDNGSDSFTTPLVHNLKKIKAVELVDGATYRGGGSFGGAEYVGILLPKGQTLHEHDHERTLDCGGPNETYYVREDSLKPVETVVGTVRAHVLDEAKRITATDRNSAYGEPEDNFQRIADFWNVFLQDKLKNEAKITAGDTAALMIMVKLAREMNAPTEDNKIDIAGYAACWAEVQSKS